jgi:hypothetical protein
MRTQRLGSKMKMNNRIRAHKMHPLTSKGRNGLLTDV